MTFEEARRRGNEYLQKSDDAMQELDSYLRGRLSNEGVQLVWHKQEEMMAPYLVGFLCEIYAGLISDPEYAMAWIKALIESGDTGNLEGRPPYREDA